MATFREIETEDMHEAWSGSIAPGVPRVLVVVLSAIVVLGAPYLLPEGWCMGGDSAAVDGDAEAFLCREDLLIWMPEDGSPFAGLFDPSGVGFTPAEAAGAPRPGPATSVAMDPDTLPEGDGVDPLNSPPVSVSVRTAPPVQIKPKELPRTKEVPEVDPEADTSSETASPSTPSTPTPAADPLKSIVIPPEIYAGVSTLIEDPKGVMGSFYAALAQTLVKPEKETDAPHIARVAHWGDSVIAADGMTGWARRFFQQQFGDAGHGYVVVDAGTTWYRPKDVKLERRGWKARRLIGGSQADGRYGFGGGLALGRKGSKASFGTKDDAGFEAKVSRYEIWYQRGPKMGTLSWRVDSGEPTLLNMNAASEGDAVEVIDVPDGPHTLHVRGTEGRSGLYGVVMEREGPGVVYDCLALVGARSSRMLNMDPTHFAEQIKQRGSDLLVIHFGGNDIGDSGVRFETWAGRYESMVKLFRSVAPETACVVMPPVDHGERRRGRVRTVPRLLKMVPKMREIAFEQGCAFYSVFDAMGGEGSAGRWHKKGLMSGDFAHPTGRGGQALGQLFYKAVMKGLADWTQEP